MTENKLKYMLKRNKLDNIINNKSEAEKLCKLETTEEVLDLLRKYNYNETKEIFERELLEILQISLSEEELNSVTGGRISHRQKLAALLGVISLTGAINIPTEAANTKTPISAAKKEKIEKKHGKNSKWMEAPREDKFAKALAGIVGVGGVVGVGSLLLYGGRKLLGSSDTHREQIKEHTITVEKKEVIAKNHDNPDTHEVETIVKKLIDQPEQNYKTLIAGISQDDLENYAISQFENWSKAMSPHYDQTSQKFIETKTWNDNFDTLLKIRWAIWLLSVKLNLLTEDELKEFSGGRIFETSVKLAENVKIEMLEDEKRIPRRDNEISEQLGKFWDNKREMPDIGLVCCSLLEVPYCLDTNGQKSKKTVLEITRLSKQYFGEHYSPTTAYWPNLGATQGNQSEENGANNVPQDEEKDPRVLIDNSNLEELAELQAPGEKWEENLATVNTIVVSLIKNPIQSYHELVAEINRDDLMTFALEGLQLWCENTQKHYNAKLKSITDAEAWNANFGLLMKVRWAIWLLCLKDKKITVTDLQNHVNGRDYAKEQHQEPFGDSLVWTERYADKATKPLPGTVNYVRTIWPASAHPLGNVKWTFCSITAALLEQGEITNYTDFGRKVGDTLSGYMPGWWTELPGSAELPL